MAIQFEFYKNPQPEKEGEEPSYHPRVVNFQHVTTQRLAKEIHMATTFGKAEVEAMLMELSRCMGNHLREGESLKTQPNCKKCCNFLMKKEDWISPDFP